MLKSQKWGRCMNSKLKTPAVEQLFEAVLSLENKDECFDFFEDVCRVNRSLNYGNDGYDRVFKRLNMLEETEE